MISGMVACRYWLALKLHFTTRNYDFFECKGRIVNFDEETYLGRRDFKNFERLAKRYGESVHEFFVANLMVGNTNIWNKSGIDSHDVYYNWLARKGARTYHLSKDLERNGIDSRLSLASQLAMKDGKAPPLFDKFISGQITPETIVMLDRCLPFLSHWDLAMSETLYGKGSLSLLKYKPFIKISDSCKSVLERYDIFRETS